MDVFKVVLLVCLIGFVSSAGTYSEIDATKGPCPGVEYRTKFNVFSFFMDVEKETYCVDGDGIVIDCELACPHRLSAMLGFSKYRPYLEMMLFTLLIAW